MSHLSHPYYVTLLDLDLTRLTTIVHHAPLQYIKQDPLLFIQRNHSNASSLIGRFTFQLDSSLPGPSPPIHDAETSRHGIAVTGQ
jgi:hypothetical protein